jgi:uncharacterized membrane protein YccC
MQGMHDDSQGMRDRSQGMRDGGLIQWPQMRLAVQTAFATVATYGFVHWFGLTQGYWAIMTTILVVQGSVGASLGHALERLFATLFGAVAGVAAVAVFDSGPLNTFISLFLTVVGLTYLSSRASFRLAPVTAAIVILSSPGKDAVLFAALERVFGIGVGALVGVLTSLFLFPQRSAGALMQHVGATAPLLSRGLSHAMAMVLGDEPKMTDEEFAAHNGEIRAAMSEAESLTTAAQRELAGFLADHADPASLLRAVRRLWHTELMAMRAARAGAVASLPLPSDDPQFTIPPNSSLPSVWPAEVTADLAPALREVRAASEAYLEGLRVALAEGGVPPGAEAMTRAVSALDDAIRRARAARHFSQMSTDDVAGLFALAFALEQLPGNFSDLSGRCRDLRRGGRITPDQLSSPSNSNVE